MKNLTKIILLSVALATGVAVLAIKLKNNEPVRYDNFITETALVKTNELDHSVYFHGPRADFYIRNNETLYHEFDKIDFASVRFNEPRTIDKDGNTIYFGSEFVSAEKYKN